MPGFNIPLGPASGCSETDVESGDGAQANLPRDIGRAHRYEIQIYGSGKTDFTNIRFYAHKVTRPNLEIDKIVIHHGQDEIYRPGKQRWQPIDISFYETLTENYDDVAKKLTEWRREVIDFKKSVIKPITELYKTIRIDILDSVGKSVWYYELLNAWPMAIQPSNLAYADSGLSEITVKVSMDKVMEQGDSE